MRITCLGQDLKQFIIGQEVESVKRTGKMFDKNVSCLKKKQLYIHHDDQVNNLLQEQQHVIIIYIRLFGEAINLCI